MEKLMHGTVFHQHDSKRLFSIQLQNGDYAVAEMIGTGTVHFGDNISGDLGNPGHAIVTNNTSLTSHAVVIHHVQCSKVQALRHTTM